MTPCVKLTFSMADFTDVKMDGLDFSCDGGKLCCSFSYTYDERPLTVCADVTVDDRIAIVILPYRIDLYVNGVLVDEEWPFEDALYDLTDLPDFISVENFEPKVEVPPAVIDTFENAEGWKPEGDIFVGDCMPYVHDGRYHVLYLKDRHHHYSSWMMGSHQWEHISTDDFVHWQIHPMAVPIDRPGEGSICTGSWIEKDGKQYLFYTVRHPHYAPAPICRSVSTDGYHFEKDDVFHLQLSDTYNRSVARDPKLFFGADGRYHMILTTALTADKRGCLAHLVSDDLDSWTECEEPLYVSGVAEEQWQQPECPDYLAYGDRYYLIVKGTDGGTKYLVSDRPFDGWREFENAGIPCGSVPKGAVWNGKIVFTGFLHSENGAYAGRMTFKTATADKNGRLIFE